MRSRCRRRMGLRRTTRWDFSCWLSEEHRSELPDHVNRIAREPGIGSDDGPSLFDALRDQQAVERVTMMQRQGFDAKTWLRLTGNNRTWLELSSPVRKGPAGSGSESLPICAF